MKTAEENFFFNNLEHNYEISPINKFENLKIYENKDYDFIKIKRKQSKFSDYSFIFDDFIENSDNIQNF
jgi:hypothetical protein